MKTFSLILLVPIIIVFLSSCKKDLPPADEFPKEEIKLDGTFEFRTIGLTNIIISAKSSLSEPLSGVRIEIYYDDPGDGTEINNDVKPIFTGITDDQGVFSSGVNIPTFVDKVYIKPNYIGLEYKVEIPVVNNSIVYEFGSFSANSNSQTNNSSRSFHTISYNTLGTWSSNGIPDYLEPERDAVDASFLADINASLPESSQLPQSHPQYLANGVEANLVLVDNADVWVTFVHEGAGYRNVLGFYTYQNGNPPSSVNEINHTIIFPNTSYHNSGGGLYTGDKIHIGQFPSGTVIGWFVIANGWSNGTVGSGNGIYYSNSEFNPESDSDLRRHNVLLYDSERDLILLGFEDINRENNGCDNDFNDAVFYTSANPITAIETSNLQPIDSPTDTDNDGVSNVFDDYPNDATKAMNNYYPGENTFGSLAFEDLWPSKGDYDFNDLVIDYRFMQITNGDNKIVEIESKFVLRASGASFQNGFGFQMNIPPSGISSVSGANYTESYISLNGNGTESAQSKATIIVFDNGRQVLHVANTDPSMSYVTPDTLSLSIVLSNPTTVQELGTAPYNPFIIVNLERGKEVHLPRYPPTDLVNPNYFGTFDDNTDINAGKYYVSDGNLPWGMNIPVSFKYPTEKTKISDGYSVFNQWALSNGFSYMDWYLPNNGYRDESKLYTP